MASSLKILFFTVLTLIFLSNLCAQSKKEQILILSKKIDSLNLVIKNDRIISQVNEITLDLAPESIAKCIDSIHVLSEANVPAEVDKDQACSDCNWYEFDKESYDEGDLIFIHRVSLDQLFFILCDKSYSIPLTYRKFNERYTDTGKSYGSGTLIFQGDGIKVVYSFYQEGCAYGSEGNVQIFENDELVKKVLVRSTL